MNETTIESTQILDSKTIKMPDGKVIAIGTHDVHFFDKLVELPLNYKLVLMQISDVELNDHLFSTVKNKSEQLLKFLNTKWFWKESSDPYNFDDLDCNEDMFELRITKSQLKGKIKRGTIKLSEIIKIIDWFDNQEELIESN